MGMCVRDTPSDGVGGWSLGLDLDLRLSMLVVGFIVDLLGLEVVLLIIQQVRGLVFGGMGGFSMGSCSDMSYV